MANPITGSRYDEAATQAILKRKYGPKLPVIGEDPFKGYGSGQEKAAGAGQGLMTFPSGGMMDVPIKYGDSGAVYEDGKMNMPGSKSAQTPTVPMLPVMGGSNLQVGKGRDFTPRAYPNTTKAWNPVGGIVSRNDPMSDAVLNARYSPPPVPANGGLGIPRATVSTPTASVPSKSLPNPLSGMYPAGDAGAPGPALRPGEYRVYDPRTNSNIQGNAEDYGKTKTVYEQKKAAWSQAGIEAAKADPARAVAFKGDRRPVNTRDAAVYDANKQAERQTAESAANRATQEKLSENSMKGEIGKREAAAAGEIAGIDAKGEWDVKAAKAKADAMAPERRADAIDKYSKALANAEPGSQLYEVIKRELTALGANPDEKTDAPAKIQEGQTATDPKTGKKMKFSGGKWIAI